MLAVYFAGLPLFVLYLVVGGLLLFVFGFVYCWLTPHDELALVRGGNLAAALALGGNLAGFSIPLDRAIAQASGVADCILWSAVAAIVQWLVYGGLRLLFHDLSAQIIGNNVAVGILLAVIAIVAGMLNAAAMTV